MCVGVDVDVDAEVDVGVVGVGEGWEVAQCGDGVSGSQASIRYCTHSTYGRFEEKEGMEGR